MCKNIMVSIIAMLVILAGCNESTPKEQISRATIPAVKTRQSFFPVTPFLRGQIHQLDSTPITPLKITTINNVIQDSSWMKRDDIHKFTAPFLSPEIDSTNLTDLFSEKSFLDQSINAFTFSYDPNSNLPAMFPLKHWDVYVDPEKNTISRVYLLKKFISNGITTTQQLTWKTGLFCQVTTVTEKDGSAPIIKEEKMLWNFSE